MYTQCDFIFLKIVFTVYPWLAWTWLTKFVDQVGLRLCFKSTGIKGARHHIQPYNFIFGIITVCVYMCGEVGDGKCNVDVQDSFQELSLFSHSRFGDLRQASRHFKSTYFWNVDTAHYFVQNCQILCKHGPVTCCAAVALAPHFGSLTSTHSPRFTEDKPHIHLKRILFCISWSYSFFIL